MGEKNTTVEEKSIYTACRQMCIHITGLKELYHVNEHCTSMLSDMFTKYNEFTLQQLERNTYKPHHMENTHVGDTLTRHTR